MTTTPLDAARLKAHVARFAGRRIAVLGDLMLDRYLWGRVDRLSPEAPVPVVDVERESFTLGGAGNVASNLAALGAHPVLLGTLGRDAAADQLLEAFGERGIDASHVIRDADRPTTVKTRLIAHAQHRCSHFG